MLSVVSHAQQVSRKGGVFHREVQLSSEVVEAFDFVFGKSAVVYADVVKEAVEKEKRITTSPDFNERNSIVNSAPAAVRSRTIGYFGAISKYMDIAETG